MKLSRQRIGMAGVLIILAVGALVFFRTRGRVNVLMAKLESNEIFSAEILEQEKTWNYIQFGSCGVLGRPNISNPEAVSMSLKYMDQAGVLVQPESHYGSIEHFIKNYQELLKTNLKANPDCDQVSVMYEEPQRILVFSGVLDGDLKFSGAHSKVIDK